MIKTNRAGAMIDLNRVKSGEKLKTDEQLALIDSHGLYQWALAIGFKSMTVAQELLGVGVPAMRYRLKVNPRNFIATCYGLNAFKVKVDIDFIDQFGLAAWGKKTGFYSSSKELAAMLGITTREGAFHRYKADSRQFVSLIRGLQFVE